MPRASDDPAWLWLPRGVLFLPRNVASVLFATPRYAVWAYEHYHLRERYMSWFFTEDVHVEVAGQVQLPAHLSARATDVFMTRTFDDDADVGSDVLATDVYDRMRLVGYDAGVRDLYGEVALSYDTLRTTRPHLAAPAPSTGWHVAGLAGVGDSESRFARFGADVQRYFDLWMGDRVLPPVDVHVQRPSGGGPLRVIGINRH